MVDAAPTPKDNMGNPEARYDARLKVTGEARYAADFAVNNPAYGMLVTSAVARGRIIGFDKAAAEAVPGVLMIMTHENRGKLGPFKFFGAGGESATARPPLSDNRIVHEGEIVALVVADSFEIAREAAHKLKVQVTVEKPVPGFDAVGVEIKEAAKAGSQHEEDVAAGDADKAFADAEVKLEAEYRTPIQHHNTIELFSTTCAWNGGELTVYEPSQFVIGFQHGLARQLEMEPDRVHVVSPFIGGAFGSKGSLSHRTALVALAAKRLNRPVKLVVTRDQGFTTATYRAETLHKLKLAAGRDGKLTSYHHEGYEVTSRDDDYVVAGTKNSAAMYATPNVKTKVYVVKADRNTPGFMRSPAEVPYMYALESAINEMADRLQLDPIVFRRINDTDRNPVNGARYTSRSLMQCYDEAAAAFGWKDRKVEPRTMRDGDWLIGWGCATACYPTQMDAATARVRLTAEGKVRVEAAAHDVGTGAYTVIAQMAAEALAVPFNAVEVRLGDSRLPPSPVSGGSVTTASVCSAVKLACDEIKSRLAKAARPDGHTAGVRVENAAMVFDNGERVAIPKAFEKLGSGAVEALGEYVPKGAKPGALGRHYKGGVGILGGALENRTMYAFGAEMVEVRIHSRTREIRVPRIVGAFAGGRIMNTRTARSQYLGGLIWGIGSALHEETELDRKRARYVNDNLAEYLIPVNADIADVKIIMVPERDTEVNPVGVKGIGELANVGTAAALTHAVYHATGIRIRELPIRIEKLLQS
jgi:xanthine dehydrogenase YagR molybdenum-binding subunit